MAKKTKRIYKRNFCVGIRIEMPTKMIKKKDIVKEYKSKFSESVIFDVEHGLKIGQVYTKGIFLARPGTEKSFGNSTFSLLISVGEDLDTALRLVKIINILGDDRVIREKVKTFFIGKSQLSLLPELQPMIEILRNIEKIVPGFIEVAWLLAPEAKLR